MRSPSRFPISPRNRIVIAAALIGLLALPLAQAPAARAGVAEDAPLDLAAMVILPADVEAEGLEGFGIGNAMMASTPDAVAEYWAYWRGDEDGATADALDEADPERVYILNLALPGEEGDPFSGTSQSVRPYIMEFADEDAAEDAFPVLAEGWATGDMEDVSTDAEIGDETFLVDGVGSEPSDEDEFERTELMFRVGSLISGVSVETFTVDHPEQEVLEALAERQLERIETVLDEGAPGLGNLVVRLDIRGENAIWDSYSVRDGDALRWYDDTDETLDAAQEWVSDNGIVDEYVLQQVVVGHPPEWDEPPLTYLLAQIIEFEDEDSAADFVATSVENVEASSFTNIEEVEDVPEVGDEIRGFTYKHVNQDVSFNDYRIYAHVGSTFFTIAINTTEEVDFDAMNDLIELQAACIEGDESCVEAIPVPEELDVPASEISGEMGSVGLARQREIATLVSHR